MQTRVAEDASSVPEAIVPEFVLRTFALGLFHRLDGDATWEAIAEPAEIAGAMGFTTLSCGPTTCLGITPEGDVHYWDTYTRGASAVSRSFGVEWSLSTVKDSAGHHLQLRDVAQGTPRDSSTDAVTAVALMDSGDVYTALACGSSGSHYITSWKPMPKLQAQLVVSVACGGGFCMALTARGEVWSWGTSSCGALGVVRSRDEGAADDTEGHLASGPVSSLAEPTQVRGALSDLHVAAIACGDEHVVAAICDTAECPGSVYSWGCGEHGRLGYEAEENGIQPDPCEVPWLTSQLDEALGARRAAGSRDKPSRLARPRRSLRLPQRITQIACGARHTALLCSGGVVCFGADDVSQLGRSMRHDDASSTGSSPDVEKEELNGLSLPAFASTPALVHSGQEEDARRLCCGPLHTAVVSLNGHLYFWGVDLTVSPKDGVLRGRPGVQCIDLFSSSQPVVALACGAHFIIASAEVELRGDRRHSSEGSTLNDLSKADSMMLDLKRHSFRPPNLPPKSEEESVLHEGLVRDFERSLQQKQDRERREEEQRRVREAAREQRLQEDADVWLSQLLPAYVPGSRPSRLMEQLWRRGVPPKVREVLWPLAIGNVLRITPQLFEIHKQKATAAREAERSRPPADHSVLVTCSADESLSASERSIQCIAFDLPRTFPTLAFFTEGGPLHEDCARILEAYSFFRPDIGYVQGMTFLAAMLLLYLPPYPAFVGLCNLINSPSVLGLYRLDPKAVECRASIFGRFCRLQLPAVAYRLEEVCLTPELFLIEWFMTIYAKCLSIDCASVVWDIFLLDGETVLYCTAIALFRICERPILDLDPDDLQGCTKILSDGLRERASDPDELIWHIHEVWRRTPPALLQEIRDVENLEFVTPSLPVAGSPCAGGLPGVGSDGQRPRTASLPGAQLLSDGQSFLSRLLHRTP